MATASAGGSPNDDVEKLKRKLRKRVAQAVDTVCGEWAHAQQQKSSPLQHSDVSMDRSYGSCRKLVTYISDNMATSPGFIEQMDRIILACFSGASKRVLSSVATQEVWFRASEEEEEEEVEEAREVMTALISRRGPRGRVKPIEREAASDDVVIKQERVEGTSATPRATAAGGTAADGAGSLLEKRPRSRTSKKKLSTKKPLQELVVAEPKKAARRRAELSSAEESVEADTGTDEGGEEHYRIDSKQVHIKMHSASVNPIDYMILEFAGEAFLKRSPSEDKPFTIGMDGAGEVVEAGSEVRNLKVSDVVYTMLPFTSFGSLAGYAVVNEEFVAVKPSNMNFDEAAAVPLVAQTAYQGMFEHAKLQEGETADKADFLKSLGANQVIDYRTEKWQDVVEIYSVDAAYNCGTENAAWNEGAQNVLKKGTGHFVTILPMVQHVKESEFGAKLVGHVHVDPSAKTLREISKYIESGKVKPDIDTVYPFEKALEAYTKLKSRHALGKLVVKVFRC
ncbi:hypothetical protein JG687_00009000 [Phytophthora cactorum]|uniref:Enoyl reductase (ER) domain-containing protein n=1 Tax=Phytophthora cactorum TaxID=29920 RepID=A0A8T1UAT7_9STRA|nr:hypothetical protein JG687_00009000 [Phytophthora cactorum]